MGEKGALRVAGACGVAAGILVALEAGFSLFTPQFLGPDVGGSLQGVNEDRIGFLLGAIPFLVLPFLGIIAFVGLYQATRGGGGGFALMACGLGIAGFTIFAIGRVIGVFSGLALGYLHATVIESQQPLVVGLADVVAEFLFWGFLALPLAFIGVAQTAAAGAMRRGLGFPKSYGIASLALGVVTVVGTFVFSSIPAIASLGVWFILAGQKVFRWDGGAVEQRIRTDVPAS